jgi:hypothetical protein
MLTSVASLVSYSVDSNDGNDMTAHLADLCSIGSTMASALAYAKQLYEAEFAYNIVLVKNDPKVKWSPNELRDLAKAKSSDSSAMYEVAQGLDRHLGKKIDSLRSIISYRKTEIENSLKG